MSVATRRLHLQPFFNLLDTTIIIVIIIFITIIHPERLNDF